eukprot:58568-Chlamydomonas_euryale.AAC.3
MRAACRLARLGATACTLPRSRHEDMPGGRPPVPTPWEVEGLGRSYRARWTPPFDTALFRLALHSYVYLSTHPHIHPPVILSLVQVWVGQHVRQEVWTKSKVLLFEYGDARAEEVVRCRAAQQEVLRYCLCTTKSCSVSRCATASVALLPLRNRKWFGVALRNGRWCGVATVKRCGVALKSSGAVMRRTTAIDVPAACPCARGPTHSLAGRTSTQVRT